MVSQETLSVLHQKYQALAPFMDERLLRRWAASEAQALGWGGASAVTQATGISRPGAPGSGPGVSGPGVRPS